MKSLNFHTDHQNKTFVALGEAYLRERDSDGKIVFEILMWTSVFRDILTLNVDCKELHPESVIYRFWWSRNYENDSWGEDKEVECDRLTEFYEHLKQLIIKQDNLYMKEYEAMIEICESALKNKNRLCIIVDSY